MKDLKYIIGFIIPLATFFSLYAGGLWSYSTLIVAFGILPFLELFMKGTSENMTRQQEEVAKNKWLFDFFLYLNVPIQYGLLVFYLFRITGGELLPFEMAGMTISFGLCCGVLGINVAHELGHRKTWYERVMAKALLLTSLYQHFYIEHNRGHHKNVATPKDPATARYGESIYVFIPRSIVMSYISAWKLEIKRLTKKGLPVLSPQNEMIRFHFMEIGLVMLIFFVFGFQTTVFFLAAALTGYFLLESVNYIEHYGLLRKETAPGRYERTMPCHSWNSNHSLGRIMLYELTRHSDHHYLASRKYQILRHFDESPQLPTGYPGAILVALVPPVWFNTMHKRIREMNKDQAGSLAFS